jgi:hypothetical protein
MEELKIAAREWAQYKGPLRRRRPGKCFYEAYMHIARGWLRFNSCLAEPRNVRIEEEKLTDFEKMVSERYALAPRRLLYASDTFPHFSPGFQALTSGFVTSRLAMSSAIWTPRKARVGQFTA